MRPVLSHDTDGGGEMVRYYTPRDDWDQQKRGGDRKEQILRCPLNQGLEAETKPSLTEKARWAAPCFIQVPQQRINVQKTGRLQHQDPETSGRMIGAAGQESCVLGIGQLPGGVGEPYDVAMGIMRHAAARCLGQFAPVSRSPPANR